VISHWQWARINSVNIFTYSSHTLHLAEEIADLARLWSAMSHKDRKAVLVFAQLQAAATAPPLAPHRLH
jgi:hypothetical protein